VGSIAFGGSLVVDADLQTIVRNALEMCLKAGRSERIRKLPGGMRLWDP
jgi:hypothetical protein